MTRPFFTTTLTQLQTDDGYHLPALWNAGSSRRAAIFLHGNGSATVFYKLEKMNAFAQALNEIGWGFLAFNNRGAHYIKSLNRHLPDGSESYERVGTAYETIADSVLDINAAIAFLQEQGIEQVVLIGESSGANKICVYDHYAGSPIVSGYVLIGGGDDMGLWRQQLGEETFSRLLQESQAHLRNGTADELIAELLPQLLTYRAFADTCNPDGDYNCFPFMEAAGKFSLSTLPLFRFFSAINRPLLVLYGDMDEFAGIPATQASEIVGQKSMHPEKLTNMLVPGADHSFHGHTGTLVDVICRWLQSLA